VTTALPDPNEQKRIQAPGLQAAPATTPQAGDPFQGRGVKLPGGEWVPNDHPLAATAQPAAPAAPAAPGATTTQGGALSAPGAVVGAQTPQGQPATVASAFQQALVNRLAPQDVSSQNPAIKGSIAANKNAEQRGLSRTQQALAERAATTGQTGAQETGLRQAIGESAGRQGAFEGNALFGLNQMQNQNQTDALGLSGNFLDSQSRQDLQRYGLDQDAALRGRALDVQSNLGGRELDIRNSLGTGNLGLGYAGLQQSGELGRAQIGANLGLGTAQLNQNALLALLNGL
jgi:hypothetical protein